MFQNHQLTCNGGPSFFPPNFTWQQIQSQHEENHHQPVVDSISPLLPAAAQFPVNPHGCFRGGGPPIFGKRSVSFSGMENCEEVNGEDYLSDEGSQANEKKRRLNIEQVRTLERNFEMGNRLEPERKLQLSRALGLQPRQIAIWFQNRRARWKTKQLEKDYDALKARYDAIKSENDALHAHNKKLHAEVLALRGRETSEPIINLEKETEGSTSNRSDNGSDLNLDITKATPVAANVTALNPQQSRSFFPSFRPSQLQKSSSENQCPKIEGVAAQEEGFNNMFCNIEDQSAFWSWSEHHNFQ